MSSLLKLRRGSTLSHETFTGADGEVTFNTDTNALVTHDGVTAGGFPHVKSADLAASSGAGLVGLLTSDATPVTTTVAIQLKKALTGNDGRSHFQIGAIPRCTAGVFSLVDDAGHHPLNVASVTQPDDYTIRINYAKTASKINSFHVQQDNELAPYGIDIGGDVGFAYANTKAYSQLSAYVNGTTVVNSLIHGTSVTATTSVSTIIVNHEPAVTGDVPVASVVYTNPANTKHIGVGYNNTQVTVTALGDLAGYLSYSGTAWDTALTDCVAASTNFTFLFINGNIRISHVALSDYNIQVTGHGGVYIPQVMDATLDYFEIGFFDYAGVKVTTPNNDMKCWFRRKGLVLCNMPAAMGVLIRRGNVAVKSTNLSGIAGNNLWVSGTMEG